MTISSIQQSPLGGIDTAFRRSVLLHGDCPAIRDDGTTLSYCQLENLVSRCAAGLHKLGVLPGDRVCILLTNRPEWLVAYLACAYTGAIATPVNVLANAREFKDIVDETNPTMVIIGQDQLDKLPRQLSHSVTVAVVGDADVSSTGRSLPWRAFLDNGRYVGPASHSDTMMSLYYSSGTSGRSKAAKHTHVQILLSAMQQIIDFELREGHSHLVSGSLSWAGAIHGLALPTLLLGGSVQLMSLGGMSGLRLASAARRSGAVSTVMVGTLLRRVLEDDAAVDELNRSRLRFVLVGGEPITAKTMSLASERVPGVMMLGSYGLSEFPVSGVIVRPSDYPGKSGTVGRAGFATEAAVLGGDKRIRDVGEGEVLLRSPMTTTGYWNRPEETDKAFVDGWFRTGDLGHLDDDGYLTILGRTKDMITSGGLNVYPREVEIVLQRLAPESRYVVVGVPDEKFGETVTAVCMGSEPESLQSLMESISNELPKYKRPRQYLTWEGEVPTGPSGKLLRRVIREWVITHDA